jgi:hypothetical protein
MIGDERGLHITPTHAALLYISVYLAKVLRLHFLLPVKFNLSVHAILLQSDSTHSLTRVTRMSFHQKELDRRLYLKQFNGRQVRILRSA